MRRNSMPNKGVPLSVDYQKDLPARPGSSFDSWYVICNFECDGNKLAFEWHHQTVTITSEMKMVTAEFLLMNASENLSIHNALTEPGSETSRADEEKLCVLSSWGEFSGDNSKMTLKLDVAEGKVDVVLKPKKEVLYNGTTGLLYLAGTDSHQFSFPNMDIEGTLTIKGKEYTIKNTTAWFDRQWGFGFSQTEGFGPGMFQVSWLWLGMTLNDDKSEAISLWDAYTADGKHAFATFLKKDGSQVNALADIKYDEVWTSKKSGKNYPRIVSISIPSEDFNVKLVSMIDDPEFVREGVNISGCQTLCNVTGTYKGKPIARDVVLEMLGDVCGEAY